MRSASMEAAIRQQFEGLASMLDERQRRLWAATEAKAWGYGGVSLVPEARAFRAGRFMSACVNCKPIRLRLWKPVECGDLVQVAER